jgi:hypothetical protein
LSEFLDARATTLAARVFRALMETAAFDLDMEHLDAVNAFINPSLNANSRRDLNMKIPTPVFFYCVRSMDFNRLDDFWQDNFSDTLSDLGLKQVPEEPCLYISTTSSVIVFFYDRLAD